MIESPTLERRYQTIDSKAVSELSALVAKEGKFAQGDYRQALHIILERKVEEAEIANAALNPTVGEMAYFTQKPQDNYAPSSFGLDLLALFVRHALAPASGESKFEGWALQSTKGRTKNRLVKLGKELHTIISHKSPEKIRAVFQAPISIEVAGDTPSLTVLKTITS